MFFKDGSLSTNADIGLGKWRGSFCELLNHVTKEQQGQQDYVVESAEMNNENDCNGTITQREVLKAVKDIKKKNKKACGIDKLPAEILQNDKLTGIITCFDSGFVPYMACSRHL